MDGRDVFISHSSADAPAARELRTLIEGGGYSCWMAPDDIVGTETWTEQILAAIEACRLTIVLVSTAANKSPHVSREVNLALGKGRALLPIRIEPVAPEGALEYLLSLVQRVDAFPPVADHGPEILRRIGAMLPKQGEARPAPQPDSPTTPPSRSNEPTATKAGQRATKRASALGPGSVVGGFTIEEVLGEGGMARVFRARQAEPPRPVALKVIRPDLSSNAAYRRRFVAEQQTLAALEHPSIVPIYAAGDDDGVLYIAMRFIDGADLGTRIAQEGHLGIRETVEILRPVADAIDYAHEVGVIHRDLKPANVILDGRGRPYLTDFGIGDGGTATHGGDGDGDVPGIVTGTAAYMAPEQVAGKPEAELGAPLDVYAFGCIAFACLVGHPPFPGPDAQSVLAAHLNAPIPSARAERPELPKVVDELLARSLAKDPAQRFATAGDLVSGLEVVARAASEGSTQPVVIPEAQTTRARARDWVRTNTPVAVMGGALGLIVLVVGAALVFGRGGPDPTPTPTAPATSQPTAAGDTVPPAGGVLEVRAPDGNTVVTTSRIVSVAVITPPTDDSAITKMLLANEPTRPAVTGALPYAASQAWTLDEGGAGTRTVYAWFGDAAGNWSTAPVSTTTAFDNPPVVTPNMTFDRTGAEMCTTLATDPLKLDLATGIISDPDPGDKLKILRLWSGGETYPGTLDLAGGIDPASTTISLRINNLGTKVVTFTDYVTVEDSWHVEATGSFSFSVGGCPAP